MSTNGWIVIGTRDCDRRDCRVADRFAHRELTAPVAPPGPVRAGVRPRGRCCGLAQRRGRRARRSRAASRGARTEAAVRRVADTFPRRVAGRSAALCRRPGQRDEAGRGSRPEGDGGTRLSRGCGCECRVPRSYRSITRMSCSDTAKDATRSGRTPMVTRRGRRTCAGRWSISVPSSSPCSSRTAARRDALTVLRGSGGAGRSAGTTAAGFAIEAAGYQSARWDRSSASEPSGAPRGARPSGS